jgi:hypothetical protein
MPAKHSSKANGRGKRRLKVPAETALGCQSQCDPNQLNRLADVTEQINNIFALFQTVPEKTT